LNALTRSSTQNLSISAESSKLTRVGWHPLFEAYAQERGHLGKIARVVAVDRGGAWVISREDLVAYSSSAARDPLDWQRRQQWARWRTPSSETETKTSTQHSKHPHKSAQATTEPLDGPLVGDWVQIEEAGKEAPRIRTILTRRSCLARKMAGLRTEAQGIAANVDHIAIITSAGQDFSLARIERYLAAVWESGASPSILLNKIDQAPDRYADWVEQLQQIALGVPIFAMSALHGKGLQDFQNSLQPGTTVALVGSSGVGKSTILNACVAHAAQRTHITRLHDEQGKHTTTRRELFLGDRDIWWIDTPGMREFSPWDAQQGVQHVFSDVLAYATQCRFRDCTHHQEPGCAVQQAVTDGQLDAKRVERHAALQREVQHQKQRTDHRAAKEKKEQWKSVTKGMRDRQKLHRELGLKEW
jgi:ribosome biogenesis GTPase